MAANSSRRIPTLSSGVETEDFSQRGILALPNPFALHSGASLRDASLAWTSVGPAQAPVVLVLGGISAHSQPAGTQGWWQAQCGVGKALDTRRFRLLGIDWLGGPDGSTGARGDSDFSRIDALDQAHAILALLNHLGIRRVHLAVGASYGGCVVQHLACLLGPARLIRAVIISAAQRASQFGLAIRSLQRVIVAQARDATEALKLARQLAMLSYRTPQELEQRFAAQPAEQGVLAYLRHHGERFVERFDPISFTRLSESLDAHTIAPQDIGVPTTLVAVREDLLVPVEQLRAFAALIAAPCELVEISSLYGHDAFLKEKSQIGAVLRRALANTTVGEVA